MPTTNGRLTQPADGDAANAQSVNTVFQQLREALADVSLRNPLIVRISGTVDGAKAALGIATTGSGVWLVAGSSGDVAVSHNGQEWTGIEENLTETVWALAQYGTTVIAVGANGMFGRSTNVAALVPGPTWSYSTPDDSYTGTFNDVAVGTTHVVAVGENGEIQRAAVGALGTLTHVDADASYTGDFVAIVYDAGAARFIAFGSDGEIQYSTNQGATWLSTGAFGGGWMDAATNGEGAIRAVTTGGDVWYSNNAATSWTQFGSSPTLDYRAITYTGVYFAALVQSTDASIILWFDANATDVDLDNTQYISLDMDGVALGVQPIVDGMTASGMLAVGTVAGAEFTIARFLGGRV